MFASFQSNDTFQSLLARSYSNKPMKTEIIINKLTFMNYIKMESKIGSVKKAFELSYISGNLS